MFYIVSYCASTTHYKMAENLEFVNKTFQFSNKTVQVLKDSFGPNGLDALVSTTSGTLMLTNDGFPVLKSLSCGSPFGSLIFQGLDLFYKNTGDFSKKFILLTREMLGEVLDVVSVDKERASEQIMCISQGMDGLLFYLPEVFDKLQTKGIVYYESTGDIDDMLKSVLAILKTTIIGKFSPKTCEILVGLLQQLLFANEWSHDVIAQLKQTTDKLLSSFSDTVWEVPGKPLTSSTILPGIIIPREFLTMVKKLPRLSESDVFNFVILGSSLGYDVPQSDSVLLLKDSQHVNIVLDWRQNYIENVVKTLANNGIELIITSVTLHETFIHVCNQYHIAAIHLIPQEDITRISHVFRISPIFELDIDLTSFIAEATSCKSIQVGQHVYVYLKPTKMLAQQIILYAPTEALCHQYSIALQNMLKILRSSFKENGDKCELSYVPGGGAFELAFAFILEEYRTLNKVNPNIKLACQIFEKALLSIPRKLSENSNCRLSIFDLKAKTRQALTAGEHVFGLDRTGNLGLLRDKGILEPTMANYTLLTSVLQLFVQILRTDKVIHVRTLPSKNVSLASEDSDCEDNYTLLKDNA